MSNSHTGRIPTELGRCTSMRLWFELNYNSLSSTVPTQLGNLKSMTSDFSLNNNEDLCGDVPTGMREVGAHATNVQPKLGQRAFPCTRYPALSKPPHPTHRKPKEVQALSSGVTNWFVTGYTGLGGACGAPSPQPSGAPVPSPTRAPTILPSTEPTTSQMPTMSPMPTSNPSGTPTTQPTPPYAMDAMVLAAGYSMSVIGSAAFVALAFVGKQVG